MDFQKILSKAKIGLLSKEELVFFSTIILGVPHREDKSVKTAETDGLEIRYNAEFFEKLTADERIFLVAHEGLHIALEHCTERAVGMDPKLWNKAADYVINLILDNIGLKMPKGGLLNYDYRNLSTKQVYDLLVEEEGKNGAGSTPDNCIGGVAVSDLKEPAAGDKQKREEIKQTAEELVMRGKTMAEMAGQMPGELGADLQRLIDSITKPAIPWQRVLQRFFNAMNKSDFSWRRPNRRYQHMGIYLPSMYSPAMGPVDFAWDVSGSITDTIFKYFVSETHFVLKKFNPEFINVMQWDHKLERTDKVRTARDLLKLTMVGGGGTQADEVIAAYAKNNSQALIVLTDGYVNTHHIPNPGKPVIWCVYHNRGFKPLWGQVVHFSMPGDM